MRIDILTLFPQMFAPVLSESILRIAQEKGLAQFRLVNVRDFARDRRHSVDDEPYGGGPGMVMAPGPVFDAVESVESPGEERVRRILLTPQGRRFDQGLAEELAREEHLILICGRYEGFDERIRIGLQPQEISIGDYVLTGGELPAMVVVDAVVRLIPCVLGDSASAKGDSFSCGMLGTPQYTRPANFRGMTVPQVLLSGDHGRVAAWRAEQARLRTLQRRPDLLEPGSPTTKEGV